MKKSFIAAIIIAASMPVKFATASGLGICEKVFTISASALANKRDGISKETLIKALPPKTEIESEPLRSMREIAEEVYSYDLTDRFVYSVYRTELCIRRESGKDVPKNFAKVFPILENCAKEEQNEKAACAMIAAGSKPD